MPQKLPDHHGAHREMVWRIEDLGCTSMCVFYAESMRGKKRYFARGFSVYIFIYPKEVK
jgi:hypothetical protein